MNNVETGTNLLSLISRLVYLLTVTIMCLFMQFCNTFAHKWHSLKLFRTNYLHYRNKINLKQKDNKGKLMPSVQGVTLHLFYRLNIDFNEPRLFDGVFGVVKDLVSMEQTTEKVKFLQILMYPKTNSCL